MRSSHHPHGWQMRFLIDSGDPPGILLKQNLVSCSKRNPCPSNYCRHKWTVLVHLVASWANCRHVCAGEERYTGRAVYPCFDKQPVPVLYWRRTGDRTPSKGVSVVISPIPNGNAPHLNVQGTPHACEFLWKYPAGLYNAMKCRVQVPGAR